MNAKPKIMLLYVAYMECLENWSKVGITGDSFEARWRTHNRAFPAPARMRKFREFWLHEADARVIEKQVKSRWSDTAEWIKMPHEKLETIIEGEIATARIRFWRRKPKKSAAAVSPAPVPAKPKPKPPATPSGLTPPKKEPGESRNDYRSRIRRWRTAQGLCNICGKAPIDASLEKRCSPCNEKITGRQKRWKAAKQASASCLLLVGFGGVQRAEAGEEAGWFREAGDPVAQVAEKRRHGLQ